MGSQWKAWLVGIALALAGFATLPAAAFGAVGDLTFASCISGTAPCTTTTPVPDVPRSITVSPDGTSVYETSELSDAVFEYARNPSTSALSFIGCIGNASGCTATTPTDAVAEPSGIAISPDGTNVYVASEESDAIDVFTRNTATGVLTFVSCFGQHTGCTTISGSYPEAILGPMSVAVSPDGKFVYVGGDETELDVLARGASGALTFSSCLGNDTGCTQLSPSLPTDAVDDFQAMAITTDGSHIYAAALNPGLVSSFSRNPTTGAVSIIGCLGDETGCTQATGVDLNYLQSIAVSPDGRNVYVPSYNGDSLIELSASSGGVLSLLGCLGDYSGCTGVTPTGLLDGDNAVAVSGDGDSVYAGSNNGIAVFSRNPATGALTESGCFSATTPCLTTDPLAAGEDSTGLAAAPDGASVYSNDTSSSLLGEFSRAVAPVTCAGGSLSVRYETAGTIAPRCSDPEGVALTYHIVSAPAHGTAVVDGGDVVYTPASGYSGADSFTVDASSFEGTSSPATVTVSVGAPPAVSSSVTVGDQRVTLTSPAVSVCVAPPKKLSVALAAARVRGSAVKFSSAALFIDKGVRRVRGHGHHRKVSYVANSTVRKLPASASLSVVGLRAGSHTLTVELAYKRAEKRHGHKVTVTVKGKIKVKFTVC